MAEALKNQRNYILGHGATEESRLRGQAKMLEPATARLLVRAGLAPGMRCLDAGCGPGDVMRLMGRVVGPEGSVTGLDIDGAIGARTLARLRAEEAGRFAFLRWDLTRDEPAPGGPYDFVFARLLLCHMEDPVSIVRRLGAIARPGGRLVLMDFDMSRLAVRPQHPAVERGFEILQACFRRGGKTVDAGLWLRRYLTDAGLPAAEGHEVEAVFGSFARIGPMLDGVLASLAPAAAALGVAAPDEIEAVRAEVRALAAADVHSGLGPLAIGVWTTVP